jgi:hypothetical protein
VVAKHADTELLSARVEIFKIQVVVEDFNDMNVAVNDAALSHSCALLVFEHPSILYAGSKSEQIPHDSPLLVLIEGGYRYFRRIIRFFIISHKPSQNYWLFFICL